MGLTEKNFYESNELIYRRILNNLPNCTVQKWNLRFYFSLTKLRCVLKFRKIFDQKMIVIKYFIGAT